MKPYKKDNEKNNNEVSEPEAVYGVVQQKNPMHLTSKETVPDCYMTLEEFGKLFHKKLDDCYAKLQNSDQQRSIIRS